MRSGRSTPRQSMHHTLALVLALVAAATGLVLGPTRQSDAAVLTTPSKDLAAEVCEDMVRDSVIAAAGESLASPQRGTWAGNRYTCTYTFADGALRVRVDVMRSRLVAKARFRALREGAPLPSTLYGIGQQGFKSRDGAVVVRKDNFLLEVDPYRLPDRFNRDSLVWSTTRAIFDCW